MKPWTWVGVRRSRDERGATSTEYALLAVMIAVVIITGVTLLGTRTAGMFQQACESVPSYDGTSTC
jgi:Flp pilus assembly pilin Flp